MAGLDFPKNPTSGQRFIDDDNNLWTFDGQRWGSELFETVNNLNDLSDYNDLSPVTGDVIYWNDDTSKWEARPLTRIDYYMKATFSTDIDTAYYGNQTLPYNTIILEEGTSGALNPLTYEYTIPMTGWWECDVHFRSDYSISSANTYTGSIYINRNGVKTIRMTDAFPHGLHSTFGAGRGSLPTLYHFYHGDRITVYQWKTFNCTTIASQCYWSMRKMLV